MTVAGTEFVLVHLSESLFEVPVVVLEAVDGADYSCLLDADKYKIRVIRLQLHQLTIIFRLHEVCITLDDPTAGGALLPDGKNVT